MSFFNHAVHVNRGVSCVECHGQINEMDTVAEAKPLGMAFCLECHRNPEQALRPLDKVFDLTWKASDRREAQTADGTRIRPRLENSPAAKLLRLPPVG